MHRKYIFSSLKLLTRPETNAGKNSNDTSKSASNISSNILTGELFTNILTQSAISFSSHITSTPILM